MEALTNSKTGNLPFSGMALDEIAEQQLTQEQDTEDCIASGEHFKMILSENGYDVCFNCGGK